MTATPAPPVIVTVNDPPKGDAVVTRATTALRQQADDDMYSGTVSETSLPKSGFRSWSPIRAASTAWSVTSCCWTGVPDEPGDFCTTWVEPEARALMEASLDKNIVDKDEYPQTAELEARCVAMLADLWHAPASDHATGTSTTGSSEAAMLGGLAAKFRWRARREAEGKTATSPNLVCGPVRCAGRNLLVTSMWRSARHR